MVISSLCLSNVFWDELNRIQDEELEAFYNKLIKERKNELTNLNNDKIDNTPFTDKINSIKATVEKQLRKLRELEHQEKDWKNSQWVDGYNDLYTTPSTLKPKDRISAAYKQPFNTVINLDNLSTDEDKKEMGRLLKEFYEKYIKTAKLNSKILIGYFVDGEWLYRSLDNLEVKESLEKMLNGNYIFSCENIVKVGSDKEIDLSLSFIDAITFRLVNNEKHSNERSGHSSAFFPYRLKKEWKWHKIFLKRYQIGCNLYSFKKQKPKEWIKYCCLVYAIQQKYPEETQLLEELSRKLDGNKYIDTYKLTEIGNIYSVSNS